jgi:hypothetical protein
MPEVLRRFYSEEKANEFVTKQENGDMPPNLNGFEQCGRMGS